MRLQLTSITLSGLLIVAGLTACSSSDDNGASQLPPSPATDSFTSWCEAPGAGVECYRPADSEPALVVFRSAGASSAVVWDPGGPGLGLPDHDIPRHLLIPQQISKHDVLLIVEPWVTSPPPGDCLAAATSQDIDSKVCDLAQWTSGSDATRTLIERWSSEQEEPIVGVYAESFGATRQYDLLASPGHTGIKWGVLESPGPLPGANAGDFFAAKRAAVLRAIGECKTNRCATDTANAFARLVAPGSPGNATARELSLGVLALTTSLNDNQASLKQLQAAVQSGEMSSEFAQSLRRAGRRYELRQADEVDPKLVALWADTCPRFQNWATVAPSADPLLDAFAWLYRGCTALPEMEVPRRSDDVRLPLLVITGTEDLVVPSTYQREWTTSAGVDNLHIKDHLNDRSDITAATTRWIARHTKQ